MRCKLKFVAMDIILQLRWCFHGSLHCFVFSTYFVFTDPELIAHVEIMRIMFSIATKTFRFLNYKNTPYMMMTTLHTRIKCKLRREDLFNEFILLLCRTNLEVPKFRSSPISRSTCCSCVFNVKSAAKSEGQGFIRAPHSSLF